MKVAFRSCDGLDLVGFELREVLRPERLAANSHPGDSIKRRLELMAASES